MQKQISFEAKPVNISKQLHVKQLNKNNGAYHSTPVRLVEFDTNNENDYKVITNTVNNWKGQLYAGAICAKANGLINKRILAEDNHIYLLTTQENNIDNLDFEKVLGITHINTANPKYAKLTYLQVKPNTQYGRTQREYTGIGKAIVTYLNMLYDYQIKLKAYFPTVKFYEKQGFKLTDTMLLEYTWTKKRE